jgi:hypothetical protein
MYKGTLKSNIRVQLSNILGWRTKRKIVVIESDDWGSIRMASPKAFDNLVQAGIPVDKSHYNKYDALESNTDLERLFQTLSKFRDRTNRPPVFTGVTIVANPDFEKIKASGFTKYFYEPFTETVKRYSEHDRVFDLWKKGIENRWMDEHMVVWGGRTVTFKGGFADHNINDLGFFTDKHNKYATREAIDVLNQRLSLFPRDEALNTESASFQASFKRWVKERVYNRLPFTLSATLYFLWRFIFQLGFLDGRSGLVYHFLQGYWYRFLVGAKLMELERAVAHLSDKSAIRAELTRLTGHNLLLPSDLQRDVKP